MKRNSQFLSRLLNRVCVFVLAPVVSLGLVSASHADVLIGNFEGGFDGWYAGGSTIANSSIGVTLGSEALQVIDADGGWGAAIELPMLDQANAAELVGAITQPGAKVSIDITTMNSDNSIPDWYLSIGLLVNCDGYWNSMDWHDGVPIGWDPLTTTMEFAVDPAAQTAIAAAGGYANVGLIANGGSTFAYYVDNVQIIVPEPSTFALAGLGMLSFLWGVRRRRM